MSAIIDWIYEASGLLRVAHETDLTPPDGEGPPPMLLDEDWHKRCQRLLGPQKLTKQARG